MAVLYRLDYPDNYPSQPQPQPQPQPGPPPQQPGSDEDPLQALELHNYLISPWRLSLQRPPAPRPHLGRLPGRSYLDSQDLHRLTQWTRPTPKSSTVSMASYRYRTRPMNPHCSPDGLDASIRYKHIFGTTAAMGKKV
ncbi:MAG: hypothetical protein LQ349_006807 [Xanthoria aureola]|nr:MAG: hypothetical protein LQ349_006807 [Xanthoria aureola]